MVSAAQAKRIVEEAPTFVLPTNEKRHRHEVYIQFAGSLSRAEITALNQALKRAGWAAQGPSGERIPSAARQNEIRYSEDNEAAANDLAAAINAAGITSKKVVVAKNLRIKANQLEAWISN